MNLRRVILFSFGLGSLSLVLLAFLGDFEVQNYALGAAGSKEQMPAQSYFTHATYFSIGEKSKDFKLKSKELMLSGKDYFLFVSPSGEVLPKGEGETIFFKGKLGKFENGPGELRLERDVEVYTANSSISANEIVYDVKRGGVHAMGKVKSEHRSLKDGGKIKIKSQDLRFWPKSNKARYEGNVEGMIFRRRLYEERITFAGDTVFLDLNIEKATLDGNVRVSRKKTDATARKGEVFLENYNKKLKYFVLVDDVKVVERVEIQGKLHTRKAFSEKLEGFMRERKLVLTGYPKVYQLNDMIKGNRITLREDIEVVEVDDALTNFRVK